MPYLCNGRHDDVGGDLMIQLQLGWLLRSNPHGDHVHRDGDLFFDDAYSLEHCKKDLIFLST